MKLGDNTLNNERLSLVMKKFPLKKLENCKPYFTALQYINNLKTIKSYKRKVNLSNFFPPNFLISFSPSFHYMKMVENRFKEIEFFYCMPSNRLIKKIPSFADV